MDFRSLTYFVTVARELNFTRASEKLNMSQPPLSNQIRLLEEELGVRLFIRGKRHLTLTEEAVRTYDTNTKVNPPLRTKGDVDALIEGLKDGTIDCVATDHAPHTVEDKVVEYHYAANGISGFETALPVLWTELVQEGRLTAMELIDKMSTSAAKIMNLPAGTLETGAAADVIVIDPDTILAVDKNEFYSKGKNTPYHERLLSGWPMLTVVDGAVVMEDRKIKE